MFWPESGSGVAGRRALIAVLALLALLAGDPHRSLRADSVSEPPLSVSPMSTHSRSFGPEERAQELYLDGMEKLDAGHSDWARSTLESLVARYPATAAATLARRQLGDLYRGDAAGDESAEARTAAGPPEPVLAPGPTLAPPAAAPAPTPSAPEVPAGRGQIWDQELRRNVSIQSKLRNEAGDRVFFGPGSAELGSRARTALAAQALWLKRWREFEAAIEGHADEPGTDQENLTLSARRAEAVRQRLIDEGVEPSRLSVVPLGRSERLASCDDPDCRAQNRRVLTLVFASGTRERLGLAGAPHAQLLDPPTAAPFVPAKTVEIPAAAQQVGVTR